MYLLLGPIQKRFLIIQFVVYWILGIMKVKLLCLKYITLIFVCNQI